MYFDIFTDLDWNFQNLRFQSFSVLEFLAVGFCLAANLPCNVDTQTCHDWGRSQQCTSQDKLCLFATWLEVRFSPSQWSLMVTEMRAFFIAKNVPRFSRFSLKIPCILKHGWLQLTWVDMQVVAPVGFTFQRTCGYWVLSRAGSAHQGLPPGGLNDLPLKLAYLILKNLKGIDAMNIFFQVKRCEIPIPAIHWRLFVLCAWCMWRYLGRIWSPKSLRCTKLISCW